jgi:hypothetical protein
MSRSTAVVVLPPIKIQHINRLRRRFAPQRTLGRTSMPAQTTDGRKQRRTTFDAIAGLRLNRQDHVLRAPEIVSSVAEGLLIQMSSTVTAL